MMTELLVLARLLLNVAMVLSALIALVLLLRRPVRAWLGSIACYWLWLLLLWLPLYSIGDNVAQWLPALGDTQQGFTVAATTASNTPALLDQPLLPIDWFMQSITDALSIANGIPDSSLWPLVVLLWFAGGFALLLWQAAKWWRFSRRVQQQGQPVDQATLHTALAALPNVRAITLLGMSSAALFGIHKPVLLLPSAFGSRHDADQQHIILAHEAVHLRRHDNAWNLAASVLVAMFWWNPLVWIGCRCFRFDQELSCDAHALAACNAMQQKRYARTLLESISSEPGFGSQPALSAWDNLNELKERMQMISQHLSTNVRPVVVRAWMTMIAASGAVLTLWLAASLSLPALAAETAAGSSDARTGARSAPPASSQEFAQFFTQFIQLMNEKKLDEARAQLPTLQSWLDGGSLSGFEVGRVLQMMFAVHIQGGNFAEARTAMERAIALESGMNDAERSQARYQLAQLWYQQERWQEGITAIEEWLATADKPTGGPYYLLAAGYYNLKQYDKAIVPAERAIAIGGDNSQESWWQMVSALYLQTEQYAKALPIVRKQVELYPDKQIYRNQLTQIEAKLQEAQPQ